MKSSIKRKKWSMGIGGLMICLCLSGCGKTDNENIAGIIQIETMEEEMSGKQTVEETENDDNAADEQNNKLERLEGSIESLEEDCFYILNTANQERIKVTYTDLTEFIVYTSTDGVTGQYAEGSASDLEAGKSVGLDGIYEGTDFQAEKVTIYIYLQSPAENPDSINKGQNTEKSQEQPQGEQVELLHGKITTTESGSFTIFRADVNGDVMVSTEESVKIVYTADTEIEVCRSSDRGITSTTSKGTAADIISGRQVRISGVYEGADFLAEKITVSIFS